MDLGSCGLAGVRQLREEREKRRRERALARGGLPGEGSSNDRGSLCHGPPEGSPRQSKRVEDMHAYLCSKVDPIMGSLILALVIDRPNDLRNAALHHLVARRRTSAQTEPDSVGLVDGSLAGVHEGGRAHIKHEKRASTALERPAQHQDRLFMVQEIGPLITELINRTLKRMPEDVEGFLIEQLQRAQHGCSGNGTSWYEAHSQGERTFLGITGNNCSPSRHNRPSTARGRLQQARDIDLALQHGSPPRAEGADSRSAGSTPRPRDGESSRVRDSSPRDRIITEGVTEKRNKPWDMEVCGRIPNLQARRTCQLTNRPKPGERSTMRRSYIVDTRPFPRKLG